MKASKPIPLAGQLACSPDVAVDDAGLAWLAWSQTIRGKGEQIVACSLDGGSIGEPIVVSTETGIEMQPCVTMLAHGTMRVFWVALRNGDWHLVTRSLRGGELGPESIAASHAGGLFHPRAALDAAGNCWVVCERVEGDRTSVAAFSQVRQAWVEQEFENAEGNCYRPDVSIGPRGMLWVGYDAYGMAPGRKSGNYRALIQPVLGSVAANDDPVGGDVANPVVVADDGYQNVHVSLASDGNGGVWIAYASNRNDARRDPAWLTKWSYLAHFDGETIREPAASRPDVDLYNEHAYQGWEFPAVAAVGGGAVLVGQSAHSHLAQSYTTDQWSRVQTLSEERWGSWKPRCRVAVGRGQSDCGTLPEPVVYVASMGLQGAQVQRLHVASPAATGRPLLVKPAPRLEAAADESANIVTRNKRPDASPPVARPTITATDGTAYNLYFGDLHAHSVYGDAVGDVDELYHRYRDRYGYDFAALTEHDFLDGIELSESELALIWNHAGRVSRDDEFLAWYAYEWTSPAISVHAAPGSAVGEGHRHVLYPDASGPLVPYGDERYNTGAKLLERLRGTRALVVPHHTSWSGTDWDAHDPELQRVAEIVSTHGRFEHAGNQPIGYRRDHIHQDKFVLDALNRGYKLGFVGGSDSHGLRWHAIEMEGRAAHIPEGTRVGWKEDAYRTGMTVILAEELTREALFDAVYNRRCYATSGVPIVVDFRINGALIGSTVALPEGWREGPSLTVRVEGTAPLRSVEVIRGGHVFAGTHMLPGEGIATSSLELTDSTLVPGESTYYYVRVLQEDGEMAWSSPIWVS